MSIYSFQFVVLLSIIASVAVAQERRLIINSFNHGGQLNTNSLNLHQGTSGTMQSFYVSDGRIHCQTPVNAPSLFFTMLGSPETGCLSLPSPQFASTFLSFRIQFPPGVDASIIMQTGTNGCGGARNDTLSVRLSNYNALDGQVSWVRIPLFDFTGPSDNLSGRCRAIVFRFPALGFSAHLQIDDLQLVSTPTGAPYWAGNVQYPSQQRWGPPRSDSRCGRDFNFAGCPAGACCSQAGFCGFTRQHCANSQVLNGLVTYGGSVGGSWRPPRADSRCGRDFGWAGCAPGLCCSQRGFCGSSPAHCTNSQQLGSVYGGGNNYGVVSWRPPRGDSRCGRDFGWAGCAPGLCCSQSGFCGSSQAHCMNSQQLGNAYSVSNNYGSGVTSWRPPRGDSRCGRDFGWAGCASGLCCSQSGFCGSSQAHCMNSQQLGSGYVMNSGGGVTSWRSPRADSRCGRSFGWAGCAPGLCCSQSGFCGSSAAHCRNSQLLMTSPYESPFNPFGLVV